MNLLESLRMGWRAIRGHRLRSALTTLGVVIGVAAVITFVTLGTSLQAEVLGQVGGGEATAVNVWVSPGQDGGGGGAGGGGGFGFGGQTVFTEHDLAELESLPGVEAAVPQGVVPLAALRLGNDTVAQRTMTVTTPAYFEPEAVAEGRAFRQGEREVVLDPAAARLFDRNASVGDRVTIVYATGQAWNATVVGILDETGEGGPLAAFGDQPTVYAPTDPFYETRVRSPTTGERERVYPFVVVRADDPAGVQAVQEAVRGYLADESDADRLRPRGYEFVVRTDEELLDQLRDLLNTLTGFVTGVAVISLVVGSIGIANVMLVSVTERTREIGIMKAVGAGNRDVLQLFLVEAAILGVLGAALGTLVGVAGGYVATRAIDLPLVFPPEWAAIAVAVGILVGVAAGLYPAWRAARTDPIDALRYE